MPDDDEIDDLKRRVHQALADEAAADKVTARVCDRCGRTIQPGDSFTTYYRTLPVHGRIGEPGAGFQGHARGPTDTFCSDCSTKPA